MAVGCPHLIRSSNSILTAGKRFPAERRLRQKYGCVPASAQPSVTTGSSRRSVWAAAGAVYLAEHPLLGPARGGESPARRSVARPRGGRALLRRGAGRQRDRRSAHRPVLEQGVAGPFAYLVVRAPRRPDARRAPRARRAAGRAGPRHRRGHRRRPRFGARARPRPRRAQGRERLRLRAVTAASST